MLYVISGNPIPLARARMCGRRIFDSQKQVKLHARICIESQHTDGNIFKDVPLQLDITFFMPTPKDPKLKKMYMAKKYHTFTPDTDNMVKLICDVAQGELYTNDCQISKINAQKLYTIDNPRTEFTIMEIKL